MQKFLCLLLLFPVFVRAQTIAIFGNDHICGNDPGNFWAIATGISEPHYKWFVNRSNVGGDSSVLIAYSLNYGDTIRCQLTNGVGDSVFSNSNDIIVNVDRYNYAEVFYLGSPLDPVFNLCLGKSVSIVMYGGFPTVQSKHGHVYISSYKATAISAGIDTLFTIAGNPCGGVDTFYRQLTILDPPLIPGTITANAKEVCPGDTLHMYTTTTEAAQWISKNGYTTTVGRSPAVVTGITPGIDTIWLRVYNACYSQLTPIGITVLPPANITGLDKFCKGDSITLTNSYPGGTWSSSNTSIATIDQSGHMIGIIDDTVFISYTLGTCTVNKREVVKPLPVISGNKGICPGNAITLSSDLPGNQWSSSNTAIAVIDNTGKMYGLSSGNAIISYTDTIGCSFSVEVTVNPFPPAISGNTDICLNRRAYLYNNAPGGKWKTSDLSTAAIDSLTGLVHGNSSGFATITYTLPTGCATAAFIKVGYCYEPQLIYPNPSLNEVIIEADTILYSEYAIINSEGKMVAHAPIAQTFTTVDIRYLPLGVYFIHLWSPNMDFVQKFVKE